MPQAIPTATAVAVISSVIFPPSHRKGSAGGIELQSKSYMRHLPAPMNPGTWERASTTRISAMMTRFRAM